MTRIPSHSIEDAPPESRALRATAQLGRLAAPIRSALMLAGKDLGEEKTDALIGVVREAAANSGHVSDFAWGRAAGCGWSDEQLAEAFAYLGLTVFTSYFLNYAGTELDIPASVPGLGPADAGWPATTSGAES